MRFRRCPGLSFLGLLFSIASPRQAVSEPEQTEISQQIASQIDSSSDVPLYRQIVDGVLEDVLTGTLETGARLPTVRQLAIAVSVHPDIVERAFRELELLGVVVRRPGQGTFVSLTPPNRSELERRQLVETLCRDIVTRADDAGVSLDELIDALAELRSSQREADARRRSP